MRQIVVFIGLMVFFGCQSKEEKFIQSEFDKVVGTWKIQSFSIGNTVPDSLKTVLKSGELLFYKCEYNKKRFSSCGIDIDLNNYIFGTSYEYDYGTKVFRLGSLASMGNASMAQQIFGNKSSLLLRGDWTFDVSGNTLTAKQITNFNKISGSISFTATRK